MCVYLKIVPLRSDRHTSSTKARKCVTHLTLTSRTVSLNNIFVRMLALGLSAWDMIETQDFREPKIELPLLVQFLPAMMSLIVDDQVKYSVLSI